MVRNDRSRRVVPERRLAPVGPSSYARRTTSTSGGSTDEPIIAVDSSEIREGRIDELKAGLTELVEPIAYRIYIDEDGARMTVVQIHPNSASMELHMRLAGPIFQTFADFVVLTRIDLYGRPSAALVEQMRQKAGMLGNAVVVVNELHAGFARFGTDTDAT